MSKLSTRESILSYEHPSLLMRLKKKENYSEAEARLAFEDMLKYLYICGSSNEVYGPTEKIDIAWHHFILYTKDYREFCQRFFGKFIEHNPSDSPTPSQIINNTIRQAQMVFGDDLSENWRVSFADCSNVCDTGGGCTGGSTNCQS